MKDGINLLDDKFTTELMACKVEEDAVKRLRDAYENAYSNLQINNQSRFEAINKIRLSKISEIKEELQECDTQLERLDIDRKSILSAYCEKNNHRFVLVKSEFIGVTDKHSFSYGFSSLRKQTFKCETCGIVSSYAREGYYSVAGKNAEEKGFPEDIYDDSTLLESGITLRMIEEEIRKIRDYKAYLYSLLKNLCELFGHDIKRDPSTHDAFKCTCCERIISEGQYMGSYINAQYRGVIPYYYQNAFSKDYVFSSDVEVIASLPTYDSYQKKIGQKKLD